MARRQWNAPRRGWSDLTWVRPVTDLALTGRRSFPAA
jgi:hypothetical protein